MDAVLRAGTFYVVLLILFRISGRRLIAEMTTFDFVLLLLISEAAQGALVGDDHSVTTGFLVIVTLLTINVGLSLAKLRSGALEKLIDGVPTVLVANGRPLRERMYKARVDEKDVLAAARRLQGLERLEQIKYAVLEASGGITIIPQNESGGRTGDPTG